MSEHKEKNPSPRHLHFIIFGAQQMKDELDFLWRKNRPVVTQQVFYAFKLVDCSENAEFTESISKIYFYYSIMTCSNISALNPSAMNLRKALNLIFLSHIMSGLGGCKINGMQHDS
jgi:hypothetical protein